MVDILEFKNKKFIKILKVKKQKKNKTKQLNLLGKKDYNLQLFLLSYIQATQEFAIQKKVKKKQYKKKIKKKKKEHQKKCTKKY